MPDAQNPDAQNPGRQPPAARRQRRGRIAAVGASLGAAIVLTGGLALANQSVAGSSTSNGRPSQTVQTPTAGGSANRDDDHSYGDDSRDDDGGWFSDDDGGGWNDPGAGASQAPDQSQNQQPDTSSGGS